MTATSQVDLNLLCCQRDPEAVTANRAAELRTRRADGHFVIAGHQEDVIASFAAADPSAVDRSALAAAAVADHNPGTVPGPAQIDRKVIKRNLSAPSEKMISPAAKFRRFKLAPLSPLPICGVRRPVVGRGIARNHIKIND